MCFVCTHGSIACGIKFGIRPSSTTFGSQSNSLYMRVYSLYMRGLIYSSIHFFHFIHIVHTFILMKEERSSLNWIALAIACRMAARQCS